MNRVDQILQHDKYKQCVRENERAERERFFCHHDMAHFLDVARIARILNEEEEYEQPVEYIYAAALLHDVGRYVQYQDGTPHEQASAQIAPEILADCGYDERESWVIVEAIANHRNAQIAQEKSLRGLIYRADKLSRPCYSCKMEAECNWKADKKNLLLRY